MSNAPATVAPKVHSAAVAVVPPASVWRRIQTHRCLHDKSFVRWPPHINLLYPFHPDLLAEGRQGSRGSDRASGDGARGPGGGSGAHDPDAAFRQLALRAGRALSRVAPFRVRLERLRTFRHSPRSLTLWVEPSLVGGTSPTAAPAPGSEDRPAGGGLQLVQSLLIAEFPACGDLSWDEARGIRGFTPHLSLGQLRDERELRALQAVWQPLEFEVDSVQLISRGGYLSPFTVRYHVPLGLDLDPDPDLGHADFPQQAPGLVPGARFAGGGGEGGGSDGGLRGGTRPHLGLRRRRQAPQPVTRLDVPYVATMANMADRLDLNGVEESLLEPQQLLRSRFASRCQVPPPLPTAADGAAASSRDGSNGGDEEGGGGGGGGEGGTAGLQEAQAAAVAAADRPRSSGHGGSGGDGGSGEADGGGGGGGRSADGGRSGGSVWWFAYGAALSASPQQVGAIESVAARLPGYRLALNRRGGRANLVAAPRSTAQPAQAATPGSSCGDAPAGAAAATSTAAVACAAGDASASAAACAAGSACTAGAAAAAAGAAEGAHSCVPGVLHRLPLDRMTRLLLAADPDAWPEEVLCVRLSRTSGPLQPADGGSSAGPGSSAAAGGGAVAPTPDAVGPSGSHTLAAAVACTGEQAPVLPAVAFRVPPERCLEAEEMAAAPPEGYVAALRRGAEQYHLTDDDPAFRAWLDALTAAAHAAAIAGAGAGPDADAAAAAATPSAGTSAAGREGGSAGGKRARGQAHSSKSRRTGADKAAAGLPRGMLDW